MALQSVQKIFLGTCVPCLKHNASKIKVRRLELDENLLAYFRKIDFYYAHDPKKICKAGDIVLIQELPKKMTTTLTHKVLEVVYPLGDITDPLTGKKVVVGSYRDEIEDKINRFGKAETAFDYKKAPPRGWQQDKKDFSHRASYIKYHEFDDDDQPYSI